MDELDEQERGEVVVRLLSDFVSREYVDKADCLAVLLAVSEYVDIRCSNLQFKESSK